MQTAIKQYGTWGFLKQRYPQIIHFNGMFHAKLLNHPFGSTTIYGTPCMMTKNMGLNWAFHGLPQFFKVPKPLFSLATSPMYPLPVLDTLQKNSFFAGEHRYSHQKPKD